MKVELFGARSTNGRRGLAVVGPEGTKFPAQGNLRHVGTAGGINTYEFLPGETGAWVLPTGDVKIHGGATLVASEDLQSSNTASLVLMGPQAVVEHYGYKRRGSSIAAYAAGVKTYIPASVLAAMGMLQVDGEVVAVEPPPVLGGAMAAAFAALKAK